MSLNFVHLSDIHFRRNVAGTILDSDRIIRNALESDLLQQIAEVGKINGILVTGDIAFSGKRDEYDVAREWLETLCGICGVPHQFVWTVPGNHDIDRSTVAESELLQKLHAALRDENIRDVDSELARLYNSDAPLRNLAYSPLSAYNEFAAAYNCEITAEQPYWEDDFTLSDGSILHMRGLNSTLISDSLDNDREYKLILGRSAVGLRVEHGIANMVLCHHPPSWLCDRDAVEDLLVRASIQLFGHKHRHRITQVGESIVLSAGAMHPSRQDVQWDPRYNILSIDIDRQENERVLAVTVYVRQWTDEYGGRFVNGLTPDGHGVRTFNLNLGSLEPQPEELAVHAGLSGEVNNRVAAGLVPNQHSEKTLAFRLVALDLIAQLRLAQQLGMDVSSLRGLSMSGLRDAIVSYAGAENKLANLWTLVAQATVEMGPMGDNPF